MNDTERVARVALGRLTEPGDLRLLPLVAELGAARVYAHLAAERGPDGLLTDVAVRLGAMDPAGDLERAERQGIRYVIPGDEEWPHQVDGLATAEPVQDRGGAPLGLWVRGPLGLHELGGSVAIVGSRSATSYGADLAAEVGAVVSRHDHAVVSGGAFGIDQAAHRGALAMGGSTVAVLACGVDRAYPAAHKSLLDHITTTGAVVSELAPGCSPTRLRFLVRNRLIAALTCGTVLVEAAVRSGALNTANWAGRLHRPVMAVPGPVSSAPSQGVHQLIRSGAATLVTSGAEVLEVVSPAGEHLAERPRGRDKPRDRLTQRHQQVLDAVPVAHDVAADSIARTAGIGLMEVRSALTRLQAMGMVERSSSGWRLAGAARS